MANPKKEETPLDYELDELKHLNLTKEEIRAHITTRRIMHTLEHIALAGGALTAISYGIYRCIPEPVKETIQNLPSEAFRVCQNIYQYLTQIPS